MDKVRYGIIGVGIQGKKYADMINSGLIQNSILTALYTTSEEKKEQLEKEYESVKVFNDYKEMFESNIVDAIITTCPSQEHTVIARNAFYYGISVLNEKPAGIHSKQVTNLNDIYKHFKKKKNISYGLFFNQRTNTIFTEIKRIVESEELGEFRRINWILNTFYRPQQYFDSASWRAKYSKEGGGLIINQAQHNLDIIYYMVGLPRTVYAKALLGYKRNITVDSDVTVTLEFENGATGSFVSCTHDMFGTDRLELDFSRGKIVVENNECTIYTFFDDEANVNKNYSNEEFRKIDNLIVSQKKIKNENAEPNKEYIMILQNFTDSILKGTPLIADGLDADKSVILSDAVNYSNYLKKEVSLPINEDDYLMWLSKKAQEEL